nr:hypothetical protein [Nonomuraea sp. NEAU-A123]
MSEAVAQRAARQQQPGERDLVAVDHPLQVGEPGVPVGRDGRQRHVHDGHVQQDDEQARAHHDQDVPLHPVPLRSGGWP